MLSSIRKYIDYLKIKKEGGQKTSKRAREIAKKHNVVIGMHSYGGCFNPEFNTGGNVVIGRYCSFGNDVKYFGGNHPIHYASMSPYFYRVEWGYKVRDIQRREIHFGNDVWVGSNALITSSCTYIGNGAVIGAGAVVTKDVPPYAIVMGIPAKITGYRFNKDVQEKLEESKWWEKEPDELIKYYDLIDKPKEWAEKIMDDELK